MDGTDNNFELDSLAKFRYEGMTIGQLLVTLAITMKQVLNEVVEARKELVDLKNTKADKKEFESWEKLLANLQSDQDKFKREYDVTIAEIKGGLKVFKILFTSAGIIWPAIILLVNHYWK